MGHFLVELVWQTYAISDANTDCAPAWALEDFKPI